MITSKMVQAAKMVEQFESEGRRQMWAGIYASVLGLNETEKTDFFRMCNARPS